MKQPPAPKIVPDPELDDAARQHLLDGAAALEERAGHVEAARRCVLEEWGPAGLRRLEADGTTSLEDWAKHLRAKAAVYRGAASRLGNGA